MADNFKGVATDGKTRPTEAAGNGAEPGVRLVKWETEPSRVASGNGADKAQPLEPLFKQADSTKPTDKPGCLTVNYDSAKGLDKPVGPDVVHLTINSPKGINLATNLIFGPGVEPHYKTVIGEPDATTGIVLRGEFDISPNLQDITLHYTDSKGIVRDQT